MIADNYFRVTELGWVDRWSGLPVSPDLDGARHIVRLVDVFPFDSTLDGTISRAFVLAKNCESASPSRRVCVYRPIAEKGPWRNVPVAWWGLGAHFGSGAPEKAAPAPDPGPTPQPRAVRLPTNAVTCTRCSVAALHFSDDGGPLCGRHYREYLYGGRAA